MDNITRFFILLDLINIEIEAGRNPLDPKIRAISRKANKVFDKELSDYEQRRVFMILDAEQIDQDIKQNAI